MISEDAYSQALAAFDTEAEGLPLIKNNIKRCAG